MKFYSTNNPRHLVSFREAVLTGLPADNGLYMPQSIPPLPADVIAELPRMSFREIAFQLASTLLGGSIDRQILTSIIESSLTFDAPLVALNESLHTLELFHGPTLAFKDVAARFMARLMSHFVQREKRELVILVATSGDTGSAVAHGFYKVPGIRVLVLYPAGKVSHIQEQQLTTLSENITALEISGAFDDCQKLVKSAFLDAELRQRYFLTSANSINIARLIPQSFYHAYAWSRLPNRDLPAVFSVPSGNFGNLTAGLMAKRMGIPISKFIAATNINDVFPNYLQTGQFQPKPSHHTLSNAMDVGNPSNFARMLSLYQNSVSAMRKDVASYSFSDQQTIAAMRTVYEKTGYMLDPHGAVGYLGLQTFLQASHKSWNGVFLETAHPAKFLDVVESALSITPEIPPRLAASLDKPKKAVPLSKNFEDFKRFLEDVLK